MGQMYRPKHVSHVLWEIHLIKLSCVVLQWTNLVCVITKYGIYVPSQCSFEPKSHCRNFIVKPIFAVPHPWWLPTRCSAFLYVNYWHSLNFFLRCRKWVSEGDLLVKLWQFLCICVVRTGVRIVQILCDYWDGSFVCESNFPSILFLTVLCKQISVFYIPYVLVDTTINSVWE
jgi:hypothetical protein